MKKEKKAVVIHSGGMDSSICLALAIKEYGAEAVTSLTFNYSQRHSIEIDCANKICLDWGVDHEIIDLAFLQKLTSDALTDASLQISHEQGEPPNTLVLGRNGLMARLGAIYAHNRGAELIYMGVLELEEENSGYRDCSRKYMDMMQAILQIDLDNPAFEIRTPLVKMTKKETLEVAQELGVLNYLLLNTVTCYLGIPLDGCQKCPACLLKAKGIKEFLKERSLSLSH